MASKRKPQHVRASDLRGVAQLATQAVEGVTRIAEGVHQSVWDTLGVRGGAAPGQTGGLTGLVYQSIRAGAQLFGKGADALLAKLDPALASAADAAPGSHAREAVIAALNGVMGDHLIASNNPLATPMTLRYRGEALDPETQTQLPGVSGKVLLLIHGLCLNDLQWRAQSDGAIVDHGAALATALGYTPIYLRYNSGLHIAQNGRELSLLLDQLIARWPTPIEELAVVAHSMGGLVIRSACHHAPRDGMRWPRKLKHIVFLGTPHHGAPLERAGNWVDAMLAGTPYTAPFAMLGRLRSAGITDLRHGSVLDDDWQGGDRFDREPDSRPIVPLPVGVACHTIAATAAARRSATADRLIGDGLVPLHSALGHHDDAQRRLEFAPASQWIAYRTNHMQLLSSSGVTQQIERWLTPSQGAGTLNR
ncbi:MAG: hypothetical protein ABIP49_09720 [Lysobacterales bacterium]